MAGAMAIYDDLVSTAIAECGGERPLEQGEGDSFVAVFGRPRDAVRCAVEIQLAVTGMAWPTVDPLRVRMAVHVGEIERSDDGRCSGHVFNRCARVREMANGGQVIVTAAVHDLVVDEPPLGVGFHHLGQARLRGLARPEDLFQLVHADLESSFPGLRTDPSGTSNLPTILSSFVGREAERSLVAGMLADGAPLVSLLGAGGCGKTRLAVEVARTESERFPDGVHFVDLAPVSDPANVAGALAAILGIASAPDEDLTDAIASHLAGHDALVVLDNCEHLLGPCAALASAIVRRCPGVSTLATSRERLGVPEEATFDLPSLSLPSERDATASSVVRSAAVKLFVDRAVSVRADFALTDTNADAVATICRRLDGIPLAIELAAARVRVLSPAQLADSLHDRFRVLVGSSRAAIARQRTLEASVEWSVQLLSDDERQVFERLSIFPASFDLAAAEAVAADDEQDRPRILDLVAGLVDKSLLLVEHTSHQARYRMLETVRVFGRQRLANATDASRVRDRHLNHFVAVARRAESGMRTPEQPRWKARLDLELDNMRIAMAYALATGAADAHLRMTAALMDFWLLRSAFEEIKNSLADALTVSTSEPAVRARALATIGWMMYMTAELRASFAMADEGVALAREVDDAEALAMNLWVRGFSGSFLALGDGDLDEALDVSARLDDPSLHLRIVNWAGWVNASGPEPIRALEDLTAGMAASESVGDLDAVGTGAYMLAAHLLFRGRLHEADTALGRSIEANRTIGNAAYLAQTLGLQVFHSAAAGADPRETAALDAELDAAYRAVNSEYFQRQLGLFRGVARLVVGEIDACVAVVGDVDYWRAAEYEPMVACMQWVHGTVALHAGRMDEARRLLDSAYEGALNPRFDAFLLFTRTSSIRRARIDGEAELAERLALDALRFAVQIEAYGVAADFVDQLAGISAERQVFDDAARLRAASDRLRADTGWMRWDLFSESDARDLQLVRDALDEPTFAGHVTEGAAMSVEDVLSYVSRGRGGRGRPPTGWASLTPTEIQVVELVAEGATNAAVAEQLFVSVNTVKTHLRHVYEKLAVSNRAELATSLARRNS